jgi:hypothetical protein
MEVPTEEMSCRLLEVLSNNEVANFVLRHLKIEVSTKEINCRLQGNYGVANIVLSLDILVAYAWYAIPVTTSTAAGTARIRMKDWSPVPVAIWRRRNVSRLEQCN